MFGVYLVKTEVQEDHVREAHPDRQDGFLGMRKEMKMWEDWCFKQKREKNNGRDPNTLERKSQGRDPRPLVENSKGGNVSTSQN